MSFLIDPVKYKKTGTKSHKSESKLLKSYSPPPKKCMRKKYVSKLELPLYLSEDAKPDMMWDAILSL